MPQNRAEIPDRDTKSYFQDTRQNANCLSILNLRYAITKLHPLMPRAMIGITVRTVLEQAAVGCGTAYGAQVPNSTAVEVIESARRGGVVDLDTPAEAITELHRDD